MPGDPFAVFNAKASKQDTLRVIWPELHDALKTIDKTGGLAQRLAGSRCPINECSGTGGLGRPTVGRLTRNGAWACAVHIEKLADRPGGWPLERIDP